jgi:hypothetical protein
MTVKGPTTSTQRVESPNNGDKLPLEAPTDQWGESHEGDRDRYPEGSAAREGEVTAPSGQGGSTPHDGVSYQDQFPPNPEPSETSKRWGEYLDAVAKAERDGSEPPDPPDMSETSPKPARAQTSKSSGGETAKSSP